MDCKSTCCIWLGEYRLHSSLFFPNKWKTLEHATADPLDFVMFFLGSGRPSRKAATTWRSFIAPSSICGPIGANGLASVELSFLPSKLLKHLVSTEFGNVQTRCLDFAQHGPASKSFGCFQNRPNGRCLYCGWASEIRITSWFRTVVNIPWFQPAFNHPKLAVQNGRISLAHPQYDEKTPHASFYQAGRHHVYPKFWCSQPTLMTN